jgi:hypothetical protein
MQQNLHLSCNIQNQQDGAEFDSLCLPFSYQGDENGEVTIILA